MIDVISMFVGIGVFVAGMVAPVLLEEFKTRLACKEEREEVVNTFEEFNKGFDEGFKEGMREFNVVKEVSRDAVEPSYFVSKGFEESEWINTPSTPPKADTDVSDAYIPMLHEQEPSGVEIMTDSMEEMLYRQAVRG